MSPLDSAGFHQSLVILLDSAGVWLFHWIPPESSGLPQQKKSGQIPWTPPEYAGFQWTPPDSSRNKYAGSALVTLRHSGSFLQRRWGSVQSSKKEMPCRDRTISNGFKLQVIYCSRWNDME